MKRLLVITFLSARAFALSDSYLSMQLDGARLQGRLDLSLNDLDYLFAVDANADGAITWGELKEKRGRILDYTLRHLAVKSEGKACPYTAKAETVDYHSDGSYLVVTLDGTCPKAPESLDVEYHLLFDEDLRHRARFELTAGDVQEAIFSPAEPGRRFSLTTSSRFRRWLQGVGASFRQLWPGDSR